MSIAIIWQNYQRMNSMKKLFILLCIGLLFTACAQQTKNETDMDFVDNVKEALADSGRIDLSSLQWTREPGGFEVKGTPSLSPPLRTPTSGSERTITSRTTMLLCCR